VDSRPEDSLWVIFISTIVVVAWVMAPVSLWILRGSEYRNHSIAASVCSSVARALCRAVQHELWHLARPCVHINVIETVIKDASLSLYLCQINNFYPAMLAINPNAVPFPLTADNEVPVSNRDTTFWDENGDVLLITTDKIAVLFQKAVLLQYSVTVQSSLGHISEQPQDDTWMPILELGCNATELRDVLEYLLLQEQYVLLSIQSGRL
jgi:hypothetical protein